MVFPGQGSQSVGMLSALAADNNIVKDTFAQASEIIGNDLWTLCQQGTAEQLADTRAAQPLMLAANIAVWRCLEQAGMPKPSVMAGHSLGEFAAWVAAGSISFEQAMALVKKRSELMAAAVPDGEGGMAAIIGMEDNDVVALCESLTGNRVTEAVNFNAPGQVVVSGHLDALEKTTVAAKEAGARMAKILPVSVPNHSSLMRHAGEQLAIAIDNVEWQQPSIPVVQNANASVPASIEAQVASLKTHVYSPVQWTQSINTMIENFSVTQVFESGPGKVLTGLGKRINKSIPTMCIETTDDINKAVQTVQKET